MCLVEKLQCVYDYLFKNKEIDSTKRSNLNVNHVRSVQDLVTSIIIQPKHISKKADANVFQVIRISFA